MTTVRIERRAFLLGLGMTATAALLSACTGTVQAPGQKPAESKPAESKQAAGQPAAQAPAQGSSTQKVVTFWGRTQFLPESNAWIAESVKMAAQESGFEVKID